MLPVPATTMAILPYCTEISMIRKVTLFSEEFFTRLSQSLDSVSVASLLVKRKSRIYGMSTRKSSLEGGSFVTYDGQLEKLAGLTLHVNVHDRIHKETNNENHAKTTWETSWVKLRTYTAGVDRNTRTMSGNFRTFIIFQLMDSNAWELFYIIFMLPRHDYSCGKDSEQFPWMLLQQQLVGSSTCALSTLGEVGAHHALFFLGNRVCWHP